MTRRWVGYIFLAWLGLVGLFITLGPLLSPYSFSQPVGDALMAPSRIHLLGTDDLGRDLWVRLAYGGRVTLAASISAAAIAIVLGATAGMAAALTGGFPERAIVWAANVTLAIPSLLVAMVLAAALRPSPLTVVLAVGVGDAPAFARTARLVFAQLRRTGYVAAATAIGASQSWIATRHVLPNALAQILPLASTHFAWALTGITTLSFLGLAGDPSLPEWGSILNSGRAYLLEAPWMALSAGIAIALTLLAVHYLSSWLSRGQG